MEDTMQSKQTGIKDDLHNLVDLLAKGVVHSVKSKVLEKAKIKAADLAATNSTAGAPVATPVLKMAKKEATTELKEDSEKAADAAPKEERSGIKKDLHNLVDLLSKGIVHAVKKKVVEGAKSAATVAVSNPTAAAPALVGLLFPVGEDAPAATAAAVATVAAVAIAAPVAVLAVAHVAQVLAPALTLLLLATPL